MDRIPPIKSVMTPFPYSVETTEGISLAKEMMDRHGIRHLPVMSDGNLVGVLSAQDIERDAEQSPRQDSRIGDVRLAEAYVVNLSEPLDRVVHEMATRHLEAAIVVKGDKLAGIFTVTDACRSFAHFLRSIFPPRDADDAA